MNYQDASNQPGQSVTTVTVDEGHAGQRLDNFLIGLLKGVPRSRIYRIIRSGEVRTNGGRCKPSLKLNSGDRVRVPPVRVAERSDTGKLSHSIDLTSRIIHQDREILVLDKPSGTAVHGGSGISAGVIEMLKQDKFRGEYLELAHRLDRETSGCLVLARSRKTLLHLHRLFNRSEDRLRKYYQAIVCGSLSTQKVTVREPLKKIRDRDGRSRVVVDSEGRPSMSVIRVLKTYENNLTLVEVQLLTGRMHQARAHCAHLKLPILGDRLYGDYALNRQHGSKKLCLHAQRIEFPHPVDGRHMRFSADLPRHLILDPID